MPLSSTTTSINPTYCLPVQISLAICPLLSKPVIVIVIDRTASVRYVEGTLMLVLFAPTLLFLELFNVIIEFVEVLPLRPQLLLELFETAGEIGQSSMQTAEDQGNHYASISF
jgi:hypothetical protein